MTYEIGQCVTIAARDLFTSSDKSGKGGRIVATASPNGDKFKVRLFDGSTMIADVGDITPRPEPQGRLF